MSWDTVKLADLAVVSSGGGAPQDADAFGTDGMPFVRAGSLVKLLSGYPEDDLELLSGDVAKAHKLKLFPAGTILFAKSGMSATKGHVYQLRKPAYVVNHLAALIPRSEVSGRYLRHVLKFKSPTSLIKDEAYPSIRLGEIENMEVPAPACDDERDRIAAVLDKADELRRLRQCAIDRLNSLGQAIFYEMFGDPISPDADKAERLAEIAELINGDRSSNYPSGDDIKDHGVLFLNTTNIQNGELNFAKAQFITPEKFASLTRGKLARGDLVITLRGTLGQCALFECKHETGFINAQMMIIRCRERVLPRYLKEFISFPSVQKKLNSSNSGSAVPQLTATQMKEMQIIVPSLIEQRTFVAAIEAARQALGAKVAYADKLDHLFTSLQHRAFSGEL
ncbi:MAG: restriction endonuclease subunit S [Pseudomonadota bacterium]